MWRIIRFIFTGKWKICNHKWKTIDERASTVPYQRREGFRVASVHFIQQCEHCGELKDYEVRA